MSVNDELINGHISYIDNGHLLGNDKMQHHVGSIDQHHQGMDDHHQGMIGNSLNDHENAMQHHLDQVNATKLERQISIHGGNDKMNHRIHQLDRQQTVESLLQSMLDSPSFDKLLSQ
jgi:hypothetical protein